MQRISPSFITFVSMKSDKRVLLGMSGGTDSSVAAMRLQEAGYEVTGVTFRFYEAGASASEGCGACCAGYAAWGFFFVPVCCKEGIYVFQQYFDGRDCYCTVSFVFPLSPGILSSSEQKKSDFKQHTCFCYGVNKKTDVYDIGAADYLCGGCEYISQKDPLGNLDCNTVHTGNLELFYAS